MLPPIPARIMRSTVEVDVCTSTDIYQNQTHDVFFVSHVHIQPTTEIRKTTSDTEQQLRSILFVDAKTSTPHLDWPAMLAESHKAGGDLRVRIRGEEYTVLSVDALRDAGDELHHYEIGLV